MENAAENDLVLQSYKTLLSSVEDFKERITRIKYSPYLSQEGHEVFYFQFDGIEYEGMLKGENKDFVLGHGIEADRAIVCKVIFNEDSTFNSEISVLI